MQTECLSYVHMAIKILYYLLQGGKDALTMPVVMKVSLRQKAVSESRMTGEKSRRVLE